MIPLAAITNLINALFSLAVAFRIYFFWKKKPDNLYLKHFFFALLFLFAYFFSLSMPGIFTRDPLLISWVVYFSEPFLLLLLLYFITLPMLLLGLKKLERIYRYIIYSFIVLALAVEPFFIAPRVEVVRDNFVFWLRPEGSFYHYGIIAIGLLAGVSAIFAMAAYLYIAIKNRKNRLVFIRSLLISISSIFYIIAALSSFIIGMASSALSIIMGTTFSLLGSLFVLISVLYRRQY